MPLETTDWLDLENGKVRLVIRDQKTTTKIGFYSFELEHPLKELMLAWVNIGRAKYIPLDGHRYVFFNVISRRRFTQQAFSKFMARAFKRVTCDDINLQKIRRMVAEGVSRAYT